MEELRPFKMALVNDYDGFADNRIQNIDRGSMFIADDRGTGDYDAKRQLFPWYCSISVEVVSRDLVKVRLQGGVPQSAAVTSWAKQYATEQFYASLVFTVSPGDVAKLNQLATAFRSIVRPGPRCYRDVAYKHVCPKTAVSLDRLQRVLAKHWA